MKIKVLFFGATADAAGERQVQIDLADGSNTADAIAVTMSAYPKLESLKLLFAVNQEYLSTDHSLLDGDELAIFTTVSGG